MGLGLSADCLNPIKSWCRSNGPVFRLQDLLLHLSWADRTVTRLGGPTPEQDPTCAGPIPGWKPCGPPSAPEMETTLPDTQKKGAQEEGQRHNQGRRDIHLLRRSGAGSAVLRLRAGESKGVAWRDGEQGLRPCTAGSRCDLTEATVSADVVSPVKRRSHRLEGVLKRSWGHTAERGQRQDGRGAA